MTVSNVLLIVVDALRWDHVGVYNEAINLTPNIDSLAEDSVVFDRCFANASTTDPSMTTIMTGQYPLRHGILNHGQEVTQGELSSVAAVESLPMILQESHHTFAVSHKQRWHERGVDSYIHPQANSDRDGSECRNDLLENTRTDGTSTFPLSYTPAEALTTLTTEVVQQRAEEDWFGYVHFMDTHIPYRPDYRLDEQRYTLDAFPNIAMETVVETLDGTHWGEYLEQLPDHIATTHDVIRTYQNGVHVVDSAIGALIHQLRELEIYEDTAIILTADHGESLTEHDIFFDHHGLYDVSLRVPLIIDAPGCSGRYDEFVQHFDIAPTVLDLLEKDYDSQQFDGVSLIGTKPKREFVVAEESFVNRNSCIRTAEHKYIKSRESDRSCRYCGFEHGEPRQLFSTREDREELENIATEEPDLVDELDAALEHWTEKTTQRRRESDINFDRDLDREQLEALGYL